MTERDNEDRYWALDIPGLTRSQAEALLAEAESRFGLTGSAIDPDRWLTRHLDPETVRSIILGLSAAAVADDEDQAVVEGVLDDFESWAASRGR